MKKLIINILTQLGTLTSLIGLIFTLKSNSNDFNGWQWGLLFLSIACFAISVWIIISDHNETKPLIFKTQTAIRNYMFSWIESSGRTVIFTRDLSWVNDDEMRDMLKNKASKGDLVICLPNRISKVDDFEKSGAVIVEYSGCNYTPESRFTITNFGRNDARIAVGKTISLNRHLIEEYKSGEHPYFYVANDLVNVLNGIKKQNK